MNVEGYGNEMAGKTPPGTYIGYLMKWIEKKKDGSIMKSKKGNQQIIGVYKVVSVVELGAGVNVSEDEIVGTEHAEYYQILPQTFFKFEKIAVALGVEADDTGERRDGKAIKRLNLDHLLNRPLRFAIVPQQIAGIASSSNFDLEVGSLLGTDEIPVIGGDAGYRDDEPPPHSDDDIPF